MRYLTTACALVGLLPVASAASVFTLPPLANSLVQRSSSTASCNHTHTKFLPEIEELFHGNKEFVESMSKMNPGLLKSLAVDGQKPPFMVVDCSDSRVNEQGIFSAGPGTMFTAGNIANQFDEHDINSNAVLSFAVKTLQVKHVIVMGHYGCGGVAAAMMPIEKVEISSQSADVAVQSWIYPIREIYETSERPAIVEHRQKSKITPTREPPLLHDPAFRALVEENVKANTDRIAKSIVMRDHYAALALASSSPPSPPGAQGAAEPLVDVWIHGWVYDVENGQVSDLGVSVGPPGRKVPPSPFPLLKT
ncbi:carbonic anhydrase [Crassisporium funariophilum]|nr:carbonic anhydrase [Crassisporium funariophilum]